MVFFLTHWRYKGFTSGYLWVFLPFFFKITLSVFRPTKINLVFLCFLKKGNLHFYVLDNLSHAYHRVPCNLLLKEAVDFRNKFVKGRTSGLEFCRRGRKSSSLKSRINRFLRLKICLLIFHLLNNQFMVYKLTSLVYFYLFTCLKHKTLHLYIS